MNITRNINVAKSHGFTEALTAFVKVLGYACLQDVKPGHEKHVEDFAKTLNATYSAGINQALYARLGGELPATGEVEVSDPPTALDEQVGGNHYKGFKIQPAVFSETNGLSGLEFCVVKRVCRHSRGGKGLGDIKKAIHELQLIAKIQYGEDV